MKCSEAEECILLRDSGELAPRHGGALAAHLHDCEGCSRFQHALVEAYDGFQALEEPSHAVLNKIRREARKLAPEPSQARIIYWKPVLAMAASIMIGLGIFLTTFQPDNVGMEFDMTETELLDSHEQFVNIMYSGLSDDDLAFNFLMTYDGET